MKLPLASTLRNRTHQTNKDARLLNGFVEVKGEVARVFKRPAIVETFAALEAGDGFGQGLFVFSVPNTSLTGGGGYGSGSGDGSGVGGGSGSSQTLVAIQNDVLNNSPVPLARYLAFSTQPINWKITTAMSPAVVVSVTDAFGNVMTGTSGTVTISLAANPSGGTLSGTLTAALSGGYATFSNLKIDKVGGGYKFAATAPNLRTARSSVFKIISNLSWTVQPSNTAPDATISVPEVSIVDSASGVITGYVGNVTVAIGANPGSPDGTLSGTLTVAAASGVASFTNLSIDELGDGYTLVASASAGNLVDKTSSAFNIADPYTLTVAADTSYYNVYNAFVAAYGTPPTSVALNVTINSGKIVSATSTAAAAMTWGSSWTGTPTFTLINNGYIIGACGNGGGGG